MIFEGRCKTRSVSGGVGQMPLPVLKIYCVNIVGVWPTHCGVTTPI